jgi:hypothetical protein
VYTDEQYEAEVAARDARIQILAKLGDEGSLLRKTLVPASEGREIPMP